MWERDGETVTVEKMVDVPLPRGAVPVLMAPDRYPVPEPVP